MKFSRQNGFSAVFVFVIVLVVSVLLVTMSSKGRWSYNSQVLGKDDESENKTGSNGKSEGKQEGSNFSGNNRQQSEGDNRGQNIGNSKERGSGLQETSETGKQNEKEAEKNLVKFEKEQEKRDDKKATKSAEIEDELEVEEASESGEETIFASGSAARSKFPLSVNPVTRTLMVTTPAGSQVVTILPAIAVENMIRAFERSGKIIEPDTENLQNGTESAELIGQIEEKNGEMVYRIKAKENEKLLGFFPITTSLVVFVSAQNGEIVSQEQGLFERLLGLISS